MSFFPSSDASQQADDGDRKNRFLHSPIGPESGSHGYSPANGSGSGGGTGTGLASGLGGVGGGSRAGNGNAGSVLGGGGVPSLRERATSQPPRTGERQNVFFSSPAAQHFIPSSVGGGGSPWTTFRSPSIGSSNSNNNGGRGPGNTAGSSNTGNGNSGGGGDPQPVPIRSSSFSAQNHSHFSSAMRERRRFPSTFEDDESEVPSGLGGDERYVLPSLSRGRTTFGHDPSRSRSQSLATIPRPPPPIGSSPSISPSFLRTPTMQSWNESLLSSFGPHTSSTTHGRYAEMMSGISGIPGNATNTSHHDVSNVSPFVRDVGEILLDDTGGVLGSLWAGMPRDEGIGSGTTSGTTSRRHSVSVVQPRSRGGSNNIVGFNAPGAVDSEESAGTRSHIFHHSSYASGTLGGSSSSSSSYYGSVNSSGATGGTNLGRGLLLTDEELADNLGLLSMNPNDPPTASPSSKYPPSQPSSLPIFGSTHSRSPVSARDTTSPFRGLGLGTPGAGGTNGGGNSYFTAASRRQQRQQLGTPTDDYSGIGDSPQLGPLGMQYDASQQQLYSTEGVKPSSPFINTHVSGYSGGTVGPSSTTPLSPTSAVSVGAGSIASTSPTTSRLLVNPQQPPYYVHQRRVSETHGMISPTSAAGQGAPLNPQGGTLSGVPTSSQNLNDLGKGIPLHSVPSSYPLFIVEFKAGRTDLYYCSDPKLDVHVGDLVIVEADRGRDLGTVINEGITVREVEVWQRQQAERAQAQAQAMGGVGPDGQPTSPGGGAPAQGTGKKEINPKMICSKAGPQDTQMLLNKTQDEQKALQLCQSKVRAKKLPMEVVDAEYQWDRRKLTFYFVAEKRIDFRELVRELFRLYKTRIWMASLQGPGGYEQ